MNNLNRFNDFNFENNLAFQEPAFIIDYIDDSLLFFSPTNNYILYYIEKVKFSYS